MLETHDSSQKIWKDYDQIHKQSPNPNSSKKAVFYSQNSRSIRRSQKNSAPELAIIIPAHNEEAYLPRTLASVNAALEQHSNACLIVVDNCSTDATHEIIEEFGAFLVKEDRKGIGQARQSGLEATPSSVRYILTTDADTVVTSDWIFCHQKALNQSNIVFTQGGFIFIPENSARISDKIGFSLLNLKKKNETGLNISVGGANNGFRRDLALECGGYNRNLTHGEDTDLRERILLFGNEAKVDSQVLTSARRVIGENPWKFILMPRCRGSVDEKYKDYRSK